MLMKFLNPTSKQHGIRSYTSIRMSVSEDNAKSSKERATGEVLVPMVQ